MRIALLLVGTALVSASLTYLWMDARREPPAPAPTAVERPTPVPVREQPTLHGRPVPPPEPTAVDEAAVAGDGGQGRGDRVPAIHPAELEYTRQMCKRDEEIRRLEAEIAHLRATLPPPELLHELERATTDEILLMARALRETAGKRLLTPPQHVADRWGDFLDQEDTGTARILLRGKYAHVIEVREGGAYWSFVTRSNSYDDEPDLQLSSGYYSTSFYGGTSGYLMDLGPLAIEEVDAAPNRPPSGLDALQLRQWAWMWTPATRPEGSGRLEVRAEGGNPKLTDRVMAHVGHTYLLRAILPDEHDVLVVFHAAEADDHGHTLVWRILKNWDIPRGR